MNKICMMGAGYVGLVSGACFADLGNTVVCFDVDEEKINSLKKGKIPIYEPELDGIVKRNLENGRLIFTTDINEAKDALIYFLCVGTPSNKDGSADLKYVKSAAKMVAGIIDSYRVIVNKSTVPVQTSNLVKDTIQEELDKKGLNIEFDVVSNPEFLAEGTAVYNFRKPDRVVIGTDSEKAKKIMEELYRAETLNNAPIIFTDIATAEIAKYASNIMLATRISSINTIASLCERTGANIKQVSKIVGQDSRIGPKFLHAGVGYGGSCFKKDIREFIATCKKFDTDVSVFEAVDMRNETIDKIKIVDNIKEHFGDIKGKSFALWGLSFKPETDDMREAPSIALVNELLKQGAKIKAYDPKAMEEAKKIFKDSIEYCESEYKALEGTDALIVVTEWNCFRQPQFNRIKESLKTPVIFDGRSIYSLDVMKDYGFTYYSVGRSPVK